MRRIARIGEGNPTADEIALEFANISNAGCLNGEYLWHWCRQYGWVTDEEEVPE